MSAGHIPGLFIGNMINPNPNSVFPCIACSLLGNRVSIFQVIIYKQDYKMHIFFPSYHAISDFMLLLNCRIKCNRKTFFIILLMQDCNYDQQATGQTHEPQNHRSSNDYCVFLLLFIFYQHFFVFDKVDCCVL